MDLYAALKAGTTEKDLLKSFEKDLANAKEKIAKEQEEEKKNAAKRSKIALRRKQLAEAIFTYENALLDGECSDSVESIEKELAGFEKDIKNSLFVLDNIEKIFF